MNITFLIGNGFDINLDMKTRYRNFYEYYKNIPSDNDLINAMKKDMGENIFCNWSDLEVALGKYTAKMKTINDMDIILEDICKNLSDYIMIEEERCALTDQNKYEFYRDFTYPEQYLPLADYNAIKEHKENWVNSDCNIDIISFNYSTTLEKLLDFNISPIILPAHNRKSTTRIRSIKHIHGLASEKNMVLGVNDIFQIHNKDFVQNQDILETIVKSECNKSMKHLVDRECNRLIENSNLICIFGLSLGDTDRIWWEKIGRSLIANSSCKLLLFWREEVASSSYINKKGRKERELKDLFLVKAKIVKDKCEDLKNKIFIGYNTDIFKIEIKKKET